MKMCIRDRLYYTPQIWTSDDTDSIERLKIQYGTSFCYPVSTMGAHVSASPNHQTGRAASLSTRATVAMAGTFGYELDPAKLTEEEKAEVRTQIETFKKYYSLIQDGTYYPVSYTHLDVYKRQDLSSVRIRIPANQKTNQDRREQRQQKQKNQQQCHKTLLLIRPFLQGRQLIMVLLFHLYVSPLQ